MLAGGCFASSSILQHLREWCEEEIKKALKGWKKLGKQKNIKRREKGLNFFFGGRLEVCVGIALGIKFTFKMANKKLMVSGAMQKGCRSEPEMVISLCSPSTPASDVIWYFLFFCFTIQSWSRHYDDFRLREKSFCSEKLQSHFGFHRRFIFAIMQSNHVIKCLFSINSIRTESQDAEEWHHFKH